MLAYRHAKFAAYFFGGGKSCTPASSTTVIALTGHERAADTITESLAAAASISSDLPASSSRNTVGAVSTQSPLPMQRVLFIVIESFAIAASTPTQVVHEQ
jgi:hypothetical protein